jgi:hypothetical protein
MIRLSSADRPALRVQHSIRAVREPLRADDSAQVSLDVDEAGSASGVAHRGRAAMAQHARSSCRANP